MPSREGRKTSEFLREYLTGHGASVMLEKANIIIDLGLRAELIREHARRRQVGPIVMGLDHLGSIKA